MLALHIDEMKYGNIYLNLRNKSIFGLFMELWTHQGFMLTLQETWWVHDSMNKQKKWIYLYITYIYILIIDTY